LSMTFGTYSMMSAKEESGDASPRGADANDALLYSLVDRLVSLR